MRRLFGDDIALSRPWARCACPFCSGEFVVGFRRASKSQPGEEGVLFHTDPECFTDAHDFMVRAKAVPERIRVLDQGGADDEGIGS